MKMLHYLYILTTALRQEGALSTFVLSDKRRRARQKFAIATA